MFKNKKTTFKFCMHLKYFNASLTFKRIIEKIHKTYAIEMQTFLLIASYLKMPFLLCIKMQVSYGHVRTINNIQCIW